MQFFSVESRVTFRNDTTHRSKHACATLFVFLHLKSQMVLYFIELSYSWTARYWFNADSFQKARFIWFLRNKPIIWKQQEMVGFEDLRKELSSIESHIILMYISGDERIRNKAKRRSLLEKAVGFLKILYFKVSYIDRVDLWNLHRIKNDYVINTRGSICYGWCYNQIKSHIILGDRNRFDYLLFKRNTLKQRIQSATIPLE